MAVNFEFSTKYTVGRGKVLASDDRKKYYDFGNSPSFNFSVTVNVLDHKSARRGLKVTDKEAIIDINVEGSIQLDTVHPENLRYFLMSDQVNETTDAAVTSTENTDYPATKGFWRNVADNGATFTPVRNVTSLTVQNAAKDTTYEEGLDYEFDPIDGNLLIKFGSVIVDAALLTVTYVSDAFTRNVIGAANVSKIEQHTWFVGNPAIGTRLWVQGFASIRPDGEIPLVGDDWVAFGLGFKYLERRDSYSGLIEVSDLGEI